MKIKLQLPVKVHVDNKGDIFISKNPTIKRSNNIDTIYHFIIQHIKEFIIEIEFMNNRRINNILLTRNSLKINILSSLSTL